ncbi:MAG: hypothetical protein O7G85_07550, partial [Planctomycetota bacterium]|nr:hypothetical protein [Planctomycetota bacterium]
YELEMPDDEGKRYFSITDQIAVSFERDDEDRVVGMTMYQAGFEFELPREGVETKSEIDESELQRYLGRYHFDQMNADTEVLIQNHRLAIDVPGQMVFELHPPDEEGKWAFRIQDRIKIRFNEDEEGRVESLTFFEGEMNYEMPRVADPEESSLPTLDQLHALRKSDERQAWLQKAGGIHITATVRLVNAGVEGTIEIKCQGTDQYSMHTDLSPFGFDYVAYDGHRGWTQSSFTPDEELEGKQLAQVRMGNPTAFLGALGNLYDSVRIVGVEEFEGREVIRVKLGRGELPDETAFFDAENGDLLKVNSSMIVIGTITMSVVVLFEDYREIDGLRMPFRFISSSEANGKTIMQFEQLKTGLEFDDETFVVELVESGIPTP